MLHKLNLIEIILILIFFLRPLSELRPKNEIEYEESDGIYDELGISTTLQSDVRDEHSRIIAKQQISTEATTEVVIFNFCFL